MAQSTYSRTPTETIKSRVFTGADQAAASPKGLQHTDFQVAYGRAEPDVELFKQRFKITAYVGGVPTDISGLLEQFTWKETSGDVFSAANTQFPLTGSMQLRKPALRQYGTLVASLFDATVSKNGVSRFGALGTVITCQVGYGKSFTSLWAMRVQPTADAGEAESVTLADGTWSLQLADDLVKASETVDDFKFTKGKKVKTRGWLAHEITVAVCAQMSIPIKQLVKGTAFVHLPAKDTQAVSPLLVIANAYQAETDKTGRTFVIRWAAPDKKHPMGALEVVPLRRNPSLLKLRTQLLDATLSRSQHPDFATVILGRAKLKGASGKDQNLTFLGRNDQAIRRFGWVHKIIDFKPVNSHLELQQMTKRALAMRLTPIRKATLSHPGIATIRRGDAIRLDIPEEGYAHINEAAFSTPKTGGISKYTAQAILAGELADPSLFALPDPSVLAATGAANTDTTKALTANTPVVVPVADQGIVFVTSVTHTVTSGSYTMDLETQFTDVLDPLTVKAQMEATIRAAKAASQPAPGAAPAAASATAGSGPKWKVKASQESDDLVLNSGPGCMSPLDGWSELMSNGSMGGLPCGTELYISANGKTIVAKKVDSGTGSSFNPQIGLYPRVSQYLFGTISGGSFDVVISRVDGQPIHPTGATQV